MPENLETFVKKLQTEGVDAGKKAAKKIEKQAKQQAEQIIADARNEAVKIVEKARGDADKQLSSAKAELEMAVRDSLLKLRESLGRALTALLVRRIEKTLFDADYLGEVIKDVVTAYADADAAKQTRIEINVPEKIGDKLKNRVLDDLSRTLKTEKDAMGLQASLAKAGFEYSIHGATVEVSADSLAEMFSEMVSPALKEIIDQAMGKEKDASEKDRKAPNEKSKAAIELKKPEGQSKSESEDRKDPGKPSG